MWNRNRRVLALLLLFLLVSNNLAFASTSLPITAEAAVEIDATTGKILYGKNQFEARPPASTTKIMTALLAIELNDPQDIVNVSKRAATTGESRLNIIENEKITIENLLYGALLKSGNDACVALAEGTSGTVEDFVRLMNMKARMLGCMNTNFTNTNGLPDPQHVSTAFDLALIARAALENDYFAGIVGTEKATVHWENGRQRQIKNTNRLLTSYPGAIGVKTGTTNAAGQCLVSAAERDGRRLIAVVLKSQNRYMDSRILLDYGFNSFSNQQLLDANQPIEVTIGKKTIEAAPENDFVVTIEHGDSIDLKKKVYVYSDLPKKVPSKTPIGYIEVLDGNELLGKTRLYAQ